MLIWSIADEECRNFLDVLANINFQRHAMPERTIPSIPDIKYRLLSTPIDENWGTESKRIDDFNVGTKLVSFHWFDWVKLVPKVKGRIDACDYGRLTSLRHSNSARWGPPPRAGDRAPLRATISISFSLDSLLKIILTFSLRKWSTRLLRTTRSPALHSAERSRCWLPSGTQAR